MGGFDPCSGWTSGAQNIKGSAVRLLENQAANALSSAACDCRNYNAVHVSVYVGGASPSATVSIEGAEAEGGAYLALPDAQSSRTVTANVGFDVIVGASWVRARIASLTGGTFTVIVTPYVSPGSSTLTIANTVDVAESSGDGLITTPTPSPISVAVTSTLALAANSARIAALVVNDSDTDIYLKRGAAAVANQGIRLNAYGGAYEMSLKGGNLYRGAVYAIHAGTGTKTLLVEDGE